MQITSLKPLAGVKILVTRPTAERPILTKKLKSLGATAIELPTIQIVPPKDPEPLNKALRRLREYDWVIFTSVHGVRSVAERMQALRVPLNALAKPKVAAIGPVTAAELSKLGRSPDFVPHEYVSRKIAEGLGALSGKRVLLARADIASNRLPSELHGRGALVDDVTAYHTVVPEGLTAEKIKSVLGSGVNLLTFTSPSTVRNLVQVAGNRNLLSYLRGTKVACIGPITADAAKELGITVDLVAETHTIDALVEAIVNEIGNL